MATVLQANSVRLNQEKITNLSLMPFGCHKGLIMSRVPTPYLDWVYTQPVIEDWPNVKEYIEQNLKAIDQELRDSGLI
jgi:uncharacterized protein (DUF3820 family)